MKKCPETKIFQRNSLKGCRPLARPSPTTGWRRTMHLVTLTPLRYSKTICTTVGCFKTFPHRLIRMCPTKGRGITTMLQRLSQPNEGTFQIQPTYIPNPMSGPSGKSLKNCFAKPHLETSGFANILFGTSSDFPWCRSTSVSRQSSTSDKAVVEFTQDNQGLWIDR